MKFDAVYYEPAIFDYPLGRQLREEYRDLPWIPIESHNSIREMQEKPNDQFGHMKRNLIAGIRKTHKYVENHKVSDYLVPYTSSGCTAMCLYCYLVCNYNKCAYLRLFVNREQMLDRIIKKGKNSGTPLTFEIGSNSDLVLENTITGNLLYTIPRFAEEGRKTYISHQISYGGTSAGPGPQRQGDFPHERQSSAHYPEDRAGHIRLKTENRGCKSDV